MVSFVFTCYSGSAQYDKTLKIVMYEKQYAQRGCKTSYIVMLGSKGRYSVVLQE